MTGSDRERELVNLLAAKGFATMRAPSSGSATERSLPDLIASRDEEWQASFAIEAKTSGDKHIYVDAEEVEKLTEFAETAGFAPLLAARFKRDQAAGWSEGCKRWFLHDPENCYRTDGGAYRITRPDDGTEHETWVLDPDEVQA